MSSASIILDSDKTQNVLDEAKSVRFKKWEHFHEDKRSKKLSVNIVMRYFQQNQAQVH